MLLLSKEHGEQKVYWKDVVAGDLIKVGPAGWQLQQQQLYQRRLPPPPQRMAAVAASLTGSANGSGTLQHRRAAA